MAFEDDKAAIIVIVKARKCHDAQYVEDNFNSYEDIPTILLEFAKTFDCMPTYLDDLLSVFADSDLTDNGVYYNHDSETLTNPIFVVHCTNCDIILDAGGGDMDEVDIAHHSTINSVMVIDKNQLGVLNIGGGSIVSLLTVEALSSILVLLVKACATNNSELTQVATDSDIKNIGIDPLATYGGIACVITPDV